MPAVTYTLNDSYGDGWNGATYTITSLADPSSVINGTMNAGSSTQNVDLDLEYDTVYRLEITEGNFPNEISSSFSHQYAVSSITSLNIGNPPTNILFYLSSDKNTGFSTTIKELSESLTALYEDYGLTKQDLLMLNFTESEFSSEYNIISNNDITYWHEERNLSLYKLLEIGFTISEINDIYNAKSWIEKGMTFTQLEDLGYTNDDLISGQFYKVSNKVTASDADQYDYFGDSVAISGDYAIVGASGNDDNGQSSGSAYIFKRDANGNWSQKDKLIASDATRVDLFGWSVAISGDYAIVGAPGNDENSGSAYIFKRDDDGSWRQKDKLTASDAESGDYFGEGDYFGDSVAISGDYAIIGAKYDGGDNSGSAYIFKRDASGENWRQKDKLTASDAAQNDIFGTSVAISGDYAIVGARGNDDNGESSGSAYIFERDASGENWSQKTKLIASDADQYDYFGRKVAISGDYAIVGAYGNDDNGDRSGSAYIFERDASSENWSQKTKLIASDAESGDYFGDSVAISGDYAIVGAKYNDENSGSAYIFERDANGSWSQKNKLTAYDAVSGNNFGISVAISDDYVIVGAKYDGNHGSAYIYHKNKDDYIPLSEAINDNLISLQYIIDQGLTTPQYIIDQGFITLQDAIDQSLVDKTYLDNNGYTAIQLYLQYNIGIAQLIEFGYTMTFSTTSGDPHVFPVHGKPYELPTTPGSYRMLQGNNLIVNASTRNIYCNERSQIQKYFKARGVSKAQINKLVDDGCFYHKVSIYCDYLSFTYDFDQKKVTFGNKASSKYFNIKTNKSCNMKAYNKYEQCESVASVYVSFTHETYGPMCLQMNYFSNPQIKYGLTCMTHDVANLSGLLIREYEIPSMTLDNLENTCEQEGIVGSNECNTELILFK